MFATLPVDDADEIAELVPRKWGFGSVRVDALIGTTRWSTSIFPDKARGSYVLPVKREVRTAERLDIGDAATRCQVHDPRPDVPRCWRDRLRDSPRPGRPP